MSRHSIIHGEQPGRQVFSGISEKQERWCVEMHALGTLGVWLVKRY